MKRTCEIMLYFYCLIRGEKYFFPVKTFNWMFSNCSDLIHLIWSNIPNLNIGFFRKEIFKNSLSKTEYFVAYFFFKHAKAIETYIVSFLDQNNTYYLNFSVQTVN